VRRDLRRAFAALAALVLLFPAARQIAWLAGVLRARFFFPLDHEWMESGHLYHAYRITHGLYLYGNPFRGFATFPYPPLYWIFLAATGSVFGLDYPTGRALSLACTIGTAAILAFTIVKHAPSRLTGLALAFAALGGIAAGYPLTGGAYDLARSDAMAIFFPVLAAALLPDDAELGRTRLFAVSAALTAAIYTKQTNVFYVVWIFALALRRDAKSGIRLFLVTVGACAALLAILCVLTDGWFFTWIVDMRNHGFRARPEWSAAIGDFFTHAPFLIAVPWLVLELRRRRALSPTAAKWTGMLVAGFFAAMLPFMKVGGWLNVLGPVFILSWPVTILLVCDLARAEGATSLRARGIFWGSLAIGGALCWLLTWEKGSLVPTAEDWTNAARLRSVIHDLDGEVVITHIPFAAVREGKTAPQESFQGAADAYNAGLGVDYVDTLEKSGARYLVVATMPGNDFRPRLRPRFEHVRDLDFRVRALPTCDLSIWRRAGAQIDEARGSR
jgi:hypothetical protein